MRSPRRWTPRSRVLRDAEKHLYAVNMGATAIGTGINAPKGYAEKTARASRQADRQADRAGRRTCSRRRGISRASSPIPRR